MHVIFLLNQRCIFTCSWITVSHKQRYDKLLALETLRNCRIAHQHHILSNLCRATSRGYINFGCSRDLLFLGGNFQWSMCRAGEIFMPVDRGSRSLEVPL